MSEEELKKRVEFLEKENKELKERVKSMNHAWSKLCPNAEGLEKRRKGESMFPTTSQYRMYEDPTFLKRLKGEEK